MDEIQFLQEAINNLHGCASVYVQTVPVKEDFRGETVWEGTVEVFDLIDHPKAKRCYAWSYQRTDDCPDYEAVTVLGLEPVTNPQRAVQVYVASLAKKGSEP